MTQPKKLREAHISLFAVFSGPKSFHYNYYYYFTIIFTMQVMMRRISDGTKFKRGSCHHLREANRSADVHRPAQLSDHAVE
jgi:hypothetical protein